MSTAHGDAVGEGAAPKGASSQSALLPSQRLRVACLLTLVGGYLDAYTYHKRGGVFANAQTGNIVKMGIALANHAKETYLRYLFPICAFVLGLFAALCLQDQLERRGIRLKRRGVLAAEIVGLCVVGLIPLQDQYNALANCVVSFVAAMQYEGFSTFRGEAIVTTMTTGNLRKFVDALYAGTVRHDPQKLVTALRFLLIVALFAGGAFFGTLACNHLERAAVVPAIVGLALVIALITALRKRNLGE